MKAVFRKECRHQLLSFKSIFFVLLFIVLGVSLEQLFSAVSIDIGGIDNNHTGFLAFRMFSAVCCGVWLELSNQKPIRGVVCILLNTNSMYTERYKEWEGFRRSWHCRKIQKFRFSQNAYLLVFGSE